jgi:hypothetical protein
MDERLNEPAEAAFRPAEDAGETKPTESAAAEGRRLADKWLIVTGISFT